MRRLRRDAWPGVERGRAPRAAPPAARPALCPRRARAPAARSRARPRRARRSTAASSLPAGAIGDAQRPSPCRARCRRSARSPTIAERPLMVCSDAEQLAHRARARLRPCAAALVGRERGCCSPSTGALRPRRGKPRENSPRSTRPAHAVAPTRRREEPRTSPRIASGVNGLVMKREAPASSARLRERSSPRVVTMMIGSVSQLVLAADELDHLDAADVGHVEVEDDEIERLERELLDRLEAARRVGEREPRLGAQAGDDHLAHHLAVVDDQNLRHYRSLNCVAMCLYIMGRRKDLQSPAFAPMLKCVHKRAVRYSPQGPMVDAGKRLIWVVDDSDLEADLARRALGAEFSRRHLQPTVARCSRRSPPAAAGRAGARLADAGHVGHRGHRVSARPTRHRAAADCAFDRVSSHRRRRARAGRRRQRLRHQALRGRGADGARHRAPTHTRAARARRARRGDRRRALAAAPQGAAPVPAPPAAAPTRGCAPGRA